LLRVDYLWPLMCSLWICLVWANFTY